MSQLSTFYPNLVTAADIGVGTASNVTFASIQNTPIGSTTPNTGVFTALTATALTAPAYNMTSGGAVVLGVSPTTTAVGSGSINIQPSRSAATQVASNSESIAIGLNSQASGVNSTCVGGRTTATSTYSTAIGHDADATQSGALALGDRTLSSTAGGIAIGSQASVTNDRSIVIGEQSSVATQFSTAIGAFVSTTVREQFATRQFASVWWSGSTTDATANVELFLGGSSGSRLTLATNTAFVADILIIGNSNASSKSYWATRRVAIRRGTGNVSLIGAVEGTESGSTASTPWSFTIDADTTNQALRIRVTGEAATSITWNATAFYRLV